MPTPCVTLVLAVDATSPAPARVLPAAVDLVADRGRLVLAVVHPPPGWTLNARMITWQQARLDQTTRLRLAPIRSQIASSGLTERGVGVHATRCHPRRPGNRARQTAAALLRVCQRWQADMLVLPSDSAGDLLTPPTYRHLADHAPAWLRIRHAEDHAVPGTILI